MGCIEPKRTFDINIFVNQCNLDEFSLSILKKTKLLKIAATTGI